MREAINSQYLMQLGLPDEKTVTVQCGTCHHGQPIPMTLEEVLFTSITNQGMDSCFAKYRALRKAYYGRSSYDFGEFSLQNLTERLDREKGHTDDAIAILKFNLEFFPESGSTYASLGDLYAKKGDKVQARASLEKAFNILHDPRIKKRIEQLSGK
jgi:tetratricopeptide (TPR) repeat protein